MREVTQFLFSWASSGNGEGSKGQLGDPPLDAGEQCKAPERMPMPLWRRLLCVPEVYACTEPFGLEEALADNATSSDMHAVSLGELTSAGDSPTSTHKSVFATSLLRSTLHGCDHTMVRGVCSAVDDCNNRGNNEGLAGECAVPSGITFRWTVSDTRRMSPLSPVAMGANALSDSCRSFTHSERDLVLQRLKQEKRKQIESAARKRRELLRDEEALLEAERSRLSSLHEQCSSSVHSAVSTGIHTEGSSTAHSHKNALTVEQLARHKLTAAPEKNTVHPGEDSPSNPSTASIDNDSNCLAFDDAVDLQELNRLYDEYKRHKMDGESNSEHGDEAERVGEPLSAATTIRAGAHLTRFRGKSAVQYPLGSVRYIERVVLGQRSQQLMALMWLLAESMRHAWRLHLQLAQLYVHYVPMYVQQWATIASRSCTEGTASLDGERCCCAYSKEDAAFLTGNKYYAYFCSGTFDFDYYVYLFSREWDTIFAAVRNYLAIDGGETASGEDKTQSPNASIGGSVGYAATVLYSMELFGRQRELQVAVRQVECWLQSRWNRLNQIMNGETCFREHGVGALLTSDDCNITATGGVVDAHNEEHKDADHGPAVRQDEMAVDKALFREASAASTPIVTLGNGDGGSHMLRDDDAKRKSDMTYLPMDWWLAQNEDLKATVSWNRKKRKLRQIQLSMQLLKKMRQQDSTCISDFSDSSTALYLSPSILPKDECPTVTLEALPVQSGEEEEEEGPQSHLVVNVGCFGFSFFSRWE
ncbi:hypothetical protein ERJ75_001045700 [Trypanosoma vivax]|nr:hypothetical protein TRVL_07807 [Trypanosoma vivax]KAH8610857.1 hypothetical protein ERJ75_001045700 [Trypanosoma vivax]